MSKSKVGTSGLGKMTPEDVAAHNSVMRAAVSPKMQNIMDEIQQVIDAENIRMDAQFEGDAKLRAWAKELLGYQVSMTQIEQLKDSISKAKSGQPFTYQQTLLIKTAFGTVDRLDRYIFALEKTIIDMTNKPTQQFNEQFTNLSFFGLIKLAFKRLFKRSK